MKKTLLTLVIVMLSLGFSVMAQTEAELNAEIKSLMTQFDGKERLKELAKIEKMKVPNPCGIKSADALSDGVVDILKAFRGGKYTILGITYDTRGLNALVPEMYKRTIGETVDGITDVTSKEKPTTAELLELSENIARIGAAIAKMAIDMKDISTEVKNAGPMEAAKAAGVLKYTAANIAFLTNEVALQAKIIDNLIKVSKSSKNL